MKNLLRICAALSSLLVCTAEASAAPIYHLTDLGTLGGSDSRSQAYGINNSGQIVGESDSSDAAIRQRAFVYSGGTMQSLTSLATNPDHWDAWTATAISDNGQITGEIDPAGPAGSPNHYFRYSNGTLSDLGFSYIPHGINSSGQIVGIAGAHAFLDTGGSITNLGSYVAYGINDSGEVVGDSGHAFLYDGTKHDLGTLGGNSSAGFGINAGGQVVGSSLLAGNTVAHAFRYSGGIMTDLGALGGNNVDSFALAINASGQIVGSTSSVPEDGTAAGGGPAGYCIAGISCRAFLYSNGTMQDLNTLVDSSAAGWKLKEAAGINDSGWIVGTGQGPKLFNAFLLTPISGLTGDYDGNGSVDSHDYDVWKSSFGSTTFLLADGNGNGVVDAADFTIWRDHVGTSPGSGTGGTSFANPAVPEPATIVLAALACVGLFFRRLAANKFFAGARALAALVCVVATVSAAPLYHLTNLGTLGGNRSQGNGINNAGQVVGYSTLLSPAGRDHAFVYSNGTMTDLNSLVTSSGGRVAWTAASINDIGQIVGSSDTDSGGADNAFLYSGGTLSDLGTLGDHYNFSQSTAINASGQVTGRTVIPGASFPPDHAFLDDGTMHDLGTLGGTNSFGYDINDSGQVVGAAYTSDPFAHAYRYDGTMHDLGTLGGTTSFAYGINNNGQVVGFASTGSGADHAFLYSGSTMTDLGTLGETFPNSYAYGINSSGQIVGSTAMGSTQNAHALLYGSGTVKDLNTLLDSSGVGWKVIAASGINDSGWIVANGFYSSGDVRDALLLTPVSGLAGDYDGDGIVGPEDYNLWKSSFGSTKFLLADGNGNGLVDAADYSVWRDRLDQALVVGSGSALLSAGPLSAVPEPSTMLLMLVASMNYVGWLIMRPAR
jgi:probable HAF family extracellular repeat protein